MLDLDHPDRYKHLMNAIFFFREAEKMNELIRMYRQLKRDTANSPVYVRATYCVIKALIDNKMLLKNSNLDNFRLGRLNLTNANLSGVQFRYAQFTRTDFTGANLSGANFEGALLSQVRLDQTNLKSSNWRGAQLDRCLIQDSNLDDAFFIGTRITRLEGVRTTFQRVFVKDCIILRSSLQSSDFSGIQCEGTRFESINFRGTSFENADIMNSDFQSCDFHHAQFKNANMKNILTDLEVQDFVGAKIIGGLVKTRKITNDRKSGDIKLQYAVTKSHYTSQPASGTKSPGQERNAAQPVNQQAQNNQDKENEKMNSQPKGLFSRITKHLKKP